MKVGLGPCHYTDSELAPEEGLKVVRFICVGPDPYIFQLRVASSRVGSLSSYTRLTELILDPQLLDTNSNYGLSMGRVGAGQCRTPTPSGAINGTGRGLARPWIVQSQPKI